MNGNEGRIRYLVEIDDRASLLKNFIDKAKGATGFVDA